MKAILLGKLLSFLAFGCFSSSSFANENSPPSNENEPPISERAIRFDSWNLSVEAYEEIKKLDLKGRVEFEFSSSVGSDYDFFFAVTGRGRSIDEFPLFEGFRLEEVQVLGEDRLIYEVKYKLKGGKDLILYIVDGETFGSRSETCVGGLIYKLMVEGLYQKIEQADVEELVNCVSQ